MSVAFPFSLSPLPAGCNNDQQAELKHLAKADAIAEEMVIAGPLLQSGRVEDPVIERLTTSIERLMNRKSLYTHANSDDCGTVTIATVEWSYRIGLMTGLRVARALDKGGAR